MEYKESKIVSEEEITDAFKKANIPYTKIKKSKLGGFYVYTSYGNEDSYMKYTIVEEGYGYVKKLREKIYVKRCFIDNQNMLNVAIMEAKIRMKKEKI